MVVAIDLGVDRRRFRADDESPGELPSQDDGRGRAGGDLRGIAKTPGQG